MPKIGPPFKKEDFFFNDREKRLFFIALSAFGGAVALGLLAVTFVAIVSSAGRAAAAAAAVATAREAAVSEPGESPAVSGRRSIPASPAAPTAVLSEEGGLLKPMSLDSFILPDDFRAPVEFDPSPFLPRTGKWDQAMIDRFWVEPRRIGLENLRKLNDKNIENLFEGVQ